MLLCNRRGDPILGTMSCTVACRRQADGTAHPQGEREPARPRATRDPARPEPGKAAMISIRLATRKQSFPVGQTASAPASRPTGRTGVEAVCTSPTRIVDEVKVVINRRPDGYIKVPIFETIFAAQMPGRRAGRAEPTAIRRVARRLRGDSASLMTKDGQPKEGCRSPMLRRFHLRNVCRARPARCTITKRS
jgi:hypothetical protein